MSLAHKKTIIQKSNLTIIRKVWNSNFSYTGTENITGTEN